MKSEISNMKYLKILVAIMFLLLISGCSTNIVEKNDNITSDTQTKNSNIRKSNTEKGEKTMKLTLNEHEYNVILNDNSTIDDILKLLPMTLKMQRYAGHEYYASLSGTPTIEGVTTTSDIKAGGIYYWDGWNAFVINFEDANIAPYKVVHIGNVNGDIVSDLKKAAEAITVNVQ